jgi:glycosyltransferase involved in cell wall biosynthesis
VILLNVVVGHGSNQSRRSHLGIDYPQANRRVVGLNSYVRQVPSATEIANTSYMIAPMTGKIERRLIISQPVVPHYRVPLFQKISERSGYLTAVLASSTFPGSPPSAQRLPEWADTSHHCVSILGQAYWQMGLELPPQCTRGDVLVVNGNPRLISNTKLLRTARRRGMGTVWWGHWRSPTSVAWRMWVRRRLMRGMDALLLYADYEAQEARAVFDPSMAVFSANNTIDTAEIDQAIFQWPEQRLAAFRRNQTVSERMVLFCGRLRRSPPTDLDMTLHALRRLADRGDDLQLVVIGSGEDQARLMSIANDEGVAERVRWLGALYDEQDLAPWFLSARCLVYPGSIGLTLMHALAYGLPVVTHSSRQLHNPEIYALREGFNGLTFTRGDVADMAEKLFITCADHELRATMSANASRQIRESYSIDAMVGRYIEAVDEASRRSLER